MSKRIEESAAVTFFVLFFSFFFFLLLFFCFPLYFDIENEASARRGL